MPSQEELDRRIKAWLKEKQIDLAIQVPYVNVPYFPDPGQVKIKRVPKLTASVKRLEVSSRLGLSVPALASLISTMKRGDAEKLYSQMSQLSVTENFDDELAIKWFTVCHNLIPEIKVQAICSFFKLADLHEKKDFHMDLPDTLACWFKVLAVFHEDKDSKIELLFQIADRYSDRFASVCLRVASGGERALIAVKNFLLLTKRLDLSREEASSVLDFTMETGWLLDKEDHFHMWAFVTRKGSLIAGRLRSALIPMSSIRLLAGILRGIEVTKGLDSFLTKERIRKARSIFRSSSKKEIDVFFSVYPNLGPLIDCQIREDFVAEIVDHRLTQRNQSEVGYSIVAFLDSTPGGITMPKLLRFLRVNDGELSGESMAFLHDLVVDTNRKKRLSPSNIIRFSAIVSRIIPGSTLTDRSALKAFHRALTEMDNSLCRWAIIQLDEATLTAVTVSSILSASSLILRASDESNKREFLSRIGVTGRLIDALSPVDRKRALSGLAPQWVETLLSFSQETEENVIEYLCKVHDISIRNRYLENVVTSLLGELNPEDPVFEDCLAFAVRGYNSSGAVEKLRETERNVFQKVFRAGGRIEIVDHMMKDLLGIPGFDTGRTEQLISGIRSICDRFSRLAVWEEGGDSQFSEFIVKGVGKILRAFVDNPETLDSINEEVIERLLEELIPEGLNSANTSGIVDPGGTAHVFFGSILPDSISLFGREPQDLPVFLFKIADEFSRSVGGMTAGEDFARYLVERLDIEIIHDLVAVLAAWLSQKPPLPIHISEKWLNNRREEWNKLKVGEDTTRVKLYSAVSVLVGSSGTSVKETILNIAGHLSKQIERAGIPGSEGLSLNWNRVMTNRLIALSGEIPLFELFRSDESVAEAMPGLVSYLETVDGFMEQDIFHAWRQAAFPPLLNCAIEIVLVSGNSFGVATEMAETATSAIEFLGYSSAEDFLSTLQESIRFASSPDNGYVLMEKNFLLPLWKRNSAKRLDLLIHGISDSRIITVALLERLSLEKRVEGKVRFMRDYANLFITVEKALLNLHSDLERSRIADALMDSWVFSGVGASLSQSVMEIAETTELVQEVFRRVKYGSGIVSASEAGEISSDMRKKYRDNADSVAIILRWTVDPAREGLLQLLEESQLLLQAAGTDSELMYLLDVHGARSGFLQDAKPFSEKPAELKRYLKALPS
ncbi:MAG: hypothetical protein KAH54_05590 [Candidatus Sabulitectum sp.]|nr:hypothetical protein [Candidatus Sabulitectum sp.]